MSKKHNKKTKEVKKCVICTSESAIKCTNCNKVYYCSKEHQKQDWNNHKNDCKPFSIIYNSILGRHLIVTRDVKQGELILKESPIVVGPSIISAPLCLNCYKPIPPLKKPILCIKCEVAPLCNVICNGNGHSSKECEIFKSNVNINSNILIQHCQIISPLRALLLRNINPEIWKQFMDMESHIEKRRDTPIWRNHKMNVEDIIKTLGILTEEDIKEELVQKICGVLDVNSFELRVPGFETHLNQMNSLRGIFLQAAMMAHDCIGNTHLAVDDNFNMTIHASVPILKGTPIYFNYTNALQGLFDRREHLKEGKYFKCTCKRCLDATENGTYMSSLICVKCRKGFINPFQINDDIHNHKSIWKCSEKNCSYQYHGSMIGSTVNCAKKIIDDLDKTDIRCVELTIKKLSSTFAPNHSIILDLKQNLVGLYSRNLQTEVTPSRKILLKKLNICKEILPVLELVEPGISRLTGIILYEMHVPLVIIANREYDNGEISAEDLLKKSLKAEEPLKKAISYLLYEPQASPEGRLAVNALNELKLLRKSISSIEKIIANKKENVDKRRKKKK